LYLVWLVIEKPAGARAGLALLLISIPQVIYVYSYSNSDAWSLTVSGALFYFVLQNPVFPLRLSHALAFGSLSALVILAKESFWTILLVASLLLLWKLLPHRHELVRRTTILWLLTWVNSTLLLIAPLKIIYPLSQGNFWGKAEAMRQERAWEAFKPDRISQPGYRLASRNYPFTEVVLNPNWYIYSIQSLYGFFGHLRNPMSLPLYGSASVGFLLQFGLAAYTIYFNWTRLSAQTRTLLWLTFATVIVSVGASLYNSWTYDLQWQGRYLFPILIPLGALLGSLWEYESRRVRLLRAVGWVGLFFLGQYGLWKYVILNPALS
ncbi:MAG: hypothetical protein RMK99_00640, partial [Anaerolineales bacterium]|nr:hypothetical protein [Anaerolineales bacterium]